jgi:hypothetical protein
MESRIASASPAVDSVPMPLSSLRGLVGLLFLTACTQVTGGGLDASADVAVEAGGPATSVDRGACVMCPTAEGPGCIDLLTDPAHCGTCDRHCTEWDDCRGGACIERFPVDSGHPALDAASRIDR